VGYFLAVAAPGGLHTLLRLTASESESAADTDMDEHRRAGGGIEAEAGPFELESG
jgi:hypothetical protein